MKTIKAVMAINTIAILIIGLFLIKKFMDHSGIEYSNLMIQNIEALSQDEEGYESSDCSLGAPFYSYVGTFSGEKEVVRHASGPFNSQGMDQCYTEEIIGCEALGSGKLSGSNYSFTVQTKNYRYESCKGLDGHKNYQ